MTPSPACIALVKFFESCSLKAFLDLAGVPTIAWGRTSGVHLNDTCTQEQADQWLMEDLQKACDCVLRACDCTLSQNELDALCSLTYNIGCGNFQHSTVRLCLSKNDYDGAAQHILDWNKATVNGQKVVIQGLVNRRLAEQALFKGV